MISLEKKTIALFFTKGVSLEVWDRIGMLDREVALYKELARSLRGVFFFTYGTSKDAQYRKQLPQNIAIVSQIFPLPAFLYSFLFPFLQWKILRTVDVLKTNQMLGSWSAVLAKILYRKKLIVRCGYEWLEVMKRRKMAFWKLKAAAFLEHLSYKAADIVVFSNEADKEYARKRFRLDSRKLFIVPNFVDTRQFAPLPIEKEEGRIFFVGKLEDQKNVFPLIEAVSSLRVRLIIVGNGSLRQSLEDFAKKRQAPVEFWGNVPNHRLPEELNKSQLFILPSLYEGHPKALLEAMSCGLPCIGTDVKGINTIIEHKKNGYLCEPSAESLRSAIETVLEDQALRVGMAEAARQTILENFTLDRIVLKELELYRKLM